MCRLLELLEPDPGSVRATAVA
eukprot:SAG22_NODE_17303_length_307_cov_0.990385_1_plen_21_part_10